MTHDSLAFPLGTNPDGISTIALFIILINACQYLSSLLMLVQFAVRIRGLIIFQFTVVEKDII